MTWEENTKLVAHIFVIFKMISFKCNMEVTLPTNQWQQKGELEGLESPQLSDERGRAPIITLCDVTTISHDKISSWFPNWQLYNYHIAEGFIVRVSYLKNFN